MNQTRPKAWLARLSVDLPALRATRLRTPERREVPAMADTQLIVESYSR